MFSKIFPLPCVFVNLLHLDGKIELVLVENVWFSCVCMFSKHAIHALTGTQKSNLESSGSPMKSYERLQATFAAISLLLGV